MNVEKVLGKVLTPVKNIVETIATPVEKTAGAVLSPIDKIARAVVHPVENITYKYLHGPLSNQYVKLILSWLVLVSIIYSINDLPMSVAQIIRHPATKVFLTFFAIYSVQFKFYKSLLITGGLVGLYYLVKNYIDHFDLVWPTTDVMPGCSAVKVADLLALFNGDKNELKKAMYSCGVPLNIELTDDNAPLISTYLVNFGKTVTSSCRPPA